MYAEYDEHIDFMLRTNPYNKLCNEIETQCGKDNICNCSHWYHIKCLYGYHTKQLIYTIIQRENISPIKMEMKRWWFQIRHENSNDQILPNEH